MGGIRGSFSEIERFRASLRAMPAAYQDIKERLGAEAQLLLTDQFQEQKDPFGLRWKQSLRASLEGGLTLSDTGRLRNSFTSPTALTLLANGFEVGSNVKYAVTHQKGLTIRPKNAKHLRFRVGGARGPNAKAGRWVTRDEVKIPKRQILPEGQLTPPWREAFVAEADAALAEHFKR